MYGGLRAAGRKPDLALVVCDTDAISAGGWVLFSSLSSFLLLSKVLKAFIQKTFAAC